MKELTMRTNVSPFRTLSLLTLAVAVGACSSDKAAEEENPDAEACEHLAEGPGVDVAAAATSSAMAPPVAGDHKRYDVTLGDVAGGKGGFVTFAAAAAGEFIFYTSEPVQLTVKDPAGADVKAEKTATSIPECTGIKGRHVYDLVVGTHILEVRAAAGKVSVIVEAGHTH
jgi:hypothetical protein